MGVFGRFKSDRRGSVGMIFGFAAIPLIGFAGAAVDYSRAAFEKSKLQRATDAAVLMLVREPRTATQAQLALRAGTVLATLYRPPQGVSVETPSVRRVGEGIVVTAKASITSAFMQVVGMRDTSFGATAQVSASQERIELALVLDNTGSMDERIGSRVKIEELRGVALKLVEDLRRRATGRDDVRVSIVPFDTEVRVDAGRYRNKDWLRWQNPGSRSDRDGWTGYIVDRDPPKDVTDDAPVMALDRTRYPTLARSEWASRGMGDLAPVQPLTSLYETAAYDGVTATIRSMRARGNTNVGLGIAWGTATLTGSIPLETPATADPRTAKRYMVVLTDGVNTQKWVDGEARTVRNPNDPAPSDPVLRLMNTRTGQSCDTAKSKGVEVFTIRLLKGDADVLGACASPPNARAPKHYFDVQSSDELKGAFDGILDAITSTHLTH